MKLGLGTGSTAKHFVELLGRTGPRRTESRRRADLGSDPRRCRALRHCADHARRHRPARSDGRRRRRDRSRAQPDQGRRRRIAAGEDRGGGVRSHDCDRRRHPNGSMCSAAFRCRSRSFRSASRRRGAAIGKALCAMRRFRANGAPKGQRRPRFCHRWRPLDCRCPSRTNRRCPASGGLAGRDTRASSSTGCSLGWPAWRFWRARREFALLNGTDAVNSKEKRNEERFQILSAAGLVLGLALAGAAGRCAAAQQPPLKPASPAASPRPRKS